MRKFTTEIEELAEQLETALLTEDYSAEHAERIAHKNAIKYLCEGLKNERTQLILEAGTFTNLSEATAKALEVDDKHHEAKIFFQQSNRGKRFNYRGGHNQQNFTNHHNGNNGRYNGNFNQYNRGGNGNSFNNNGFQTYHYNNRNNNNNNNGFQNRRNNEQRNNFGNNQNRHNNLNNQQGTSRQIFCNRAENGQFPQQNQVGGESQIQLNQLTNRQQNDSSR